MGAYVGNVPDNYNPGRTASRLIFGFEFPDIMNDFGNGKPESAVLSVSFAAVTSTSKGPSKFGRFVNAWRGKPLTDQELMLFNWTKLVGVHAYINIVHEPAKTGNGFAARVGGIGPVPKGVTRTEGKNAQVVYSVLDHRAEAYEKLPPWVRELVATSTEFAKLNAPQKGSVNTAGAGVIKNDEDVPF